MDDFASDAEAVLAAVGPMPIVGHSLGGITAAFVSQRHPELTPALFMETRRSTSATERCSTAPPSPSCSR
jgi:pimeloyl-ACP methyl ester carboxylesterase